MLRLQNKYRNTLKKEPERIAKVARELGMAQEAEKMEKSKKDKTERVPALPDKDFLRHRLENEINALYDRLATALKEENARLRAENERLKNSLNNKNA